MFCFTVMDHWLKPEKYEFEFSGIFNEFYYPFDN